MVVVWWWCDGGGWVVGDGWWWMVVGWWSVMDSGVVVPVSVGMGMGETVGVGAYLGLVVGMDPELVCSCCNASRWGGRV